MLTSRDLFAMNCCMCNDFCAIYAEKPLRMPGELLECSVEEPHAAAKRAALNVVIRGGELDQSLKETLF